MDPLSISMAVLTVAGIAKKLYPLVKDVIVVRGEEKEYLEKFNRFVDDLTTLGERLKRVEVWVNSRGISKDPDQAKAVYAVLENMAAADGDRGAIEESTYAFEKYLGDRKKSDFWQHFSRLTWTDRKKKLKEDIEKLRLRINVMRGKLSDVDSVIHYDAVEQLLTYNEDRSMADLLSWLAPHPIHHAPVITAHELDCTTDFTSSELFQQWIEDHSWQLNCFGEPGSGKTYRSRSVLTYMQSRPFAKTSPIMSIFFHRADKEKQSALDVLSSLLVQLIEFNKSQVPKGLKDMWIRNKRLGAQRLSYNDIKEFLLVELGRHSKKYLVIDALDEADGCEDKFLSELVMLQKQGVCVFATDRYDPRRSWKVFCNECHKGAKDGQDGLEFYYSCMSCVHAQTSRHNLCMDCIKKPDAGCPVDKTHVMTHPDVIYSRVTTSVNDMKKYVADIIHDQQDERLADSNESDFYEGRVTKLRQLKDDFGSEFWAALPNVITEIADGKIIFASLILKQLKMSPAPRDFEATLQKLQGNSANKFDELYNELLDLCFSSQDKAYAKIARDCLGLMSASFETMTLVELQHALAVQTGDKSLEDFRRGIIKPFDIREATQGLVVIDGFNYEGEAPVRLYHSTLAEFLRHRDQKWLQESDRRLLAACITYLKLKDFAEPFASVNTLDKTIATYPFAKYAVHNWFQHAHKLQLTVEEKLSILDLLQDSNRMQCILQVAWATSRNRKSLAWDVVSGLDAMHTCAGCGMNDLCSAMIRGGADINVREETYGQTPLMYAAKNGMLDTVELLLKAGADPNVVSYKNRTALIEAVNEQRSEIVRALLTNPRTNCNVKGRTEKSSTALIQAAKKDDTSILEMLLNAKHTDVNATDGQGCTALHRAVQFGKIKNIEILLARRDISLSLIDAVGSRKALEWTAVCMLEYRDNKALIHQMANLLAKHKPVVGPSGLEIQKVMNEGKTELLEIYLGIDSSPDWIDEHGRNHLHVATAGGRADMVKMIHRHIKDAKGFRIDAQDKNGMTALHLACSESCSPMSQEIVQYLLENGASPEVEESEGMTPLEMAEYCYDSGWRDSLHDVFIKCGKKVDETSRKHLAGKKRVRLPFRRRGDPRAYIKENRTELEKLRDKITGATPLHDAINMNRPDILGVLLNETHIDVNTQDSDMQTPLHRAVRKMDLKSIGSLLKAHANPDFKDRWGYTPMQHALMSSNRAFELVVCQLVEGGVKFPSLSTVRKDLLIKTVGARSLTTVKSLIDAGADVFYRDPDTRKTALEFALDLKADALAEAADNVLNDRVPSTSKDWQDADTLKQCFESQQDVIEISKIVKYLEDSEQRLRRPVALKRSSIDFGRVKQYLSEENTTPRVDKASGLVETPPPAYEVHEGKGHEKSYIGSSIADAMQKEASSAKAKQRNEADENRVRLEAALLARMEKSQPLISDKVGIAFAIMIGVVAIVYILKN